MMTIQNEPHLNTNHVLSSGLNLKAELEKMDDVGWKAKLKIPPKDRRIKTSVSILFVESIYTHCSYIIYVNSASCKFHSQFC